MGKGWLDGIRDVLRHRWLVLRSSGLGVFVGSIPGLGGTVVDWISYGFAIHTCPNPETFGKGDIRGVIAPESSNNAKEGVALIPSLLFGVPGSGTRITTANFISSQKSAWAGYIQDDWKVAPKLTVNLGVRYELFSPIAEKFARQSNFEYMRARPTLVIPKGPNQDAPLPPNFATDFPQIEVERGRVDKYMIGWDKTNISPRFGLAVQLVERVREVATEKAATPAQVAALAPHVLNAAREGETVAQRIVEEGAVELSQLVQSLSRHFSASEDIRIATAGGLLRPGSPLLAALRARLGTDVTRAHLTALSGSVDAPLGALRLAVELLQPE